MESVQPRAFWLAAMHRIADPVMYALAKGELKKTMPVEQLSNAGRESCTHLEAFGRTLVGIAPWLENREGLSEAEERDRADYAETVRTALANAVDPASPDFMNFSDGYQPIVDAAFLCQGLLRAPKELFEALNPVTARHLIDALKQTRSRKPFHNNWLLFSAIIEAFLCRAGESDWDAMRIDYALRQHMQWYKGDGVYGDGSEFHFDYYNSFVIQPMLMDILNAVGDRYPDWQKLTPVVAARLSHYATVLENLIAPDGSYPVVGRSATYRFGAFHALAQAAFLDMPEPRLTPAGVRCALTAVLERVMEAPGNFDGDGWLRIGVYGHQPGLGENYISTGSLYLCSAVFLPLGLSPQHSFWNGASCNWTSKTIWSGGQTEKYETFCNR